MQQQQQQLIRHEEQQQQQQQQPSSRQYSHAHASDQIQSSHAVSCAAQQLGWEGWQYYRAVMMHQQRQFSSQVIHATLLCCPLLASALTALSGLKAEFWYCLPDREPLTPSPAQLLISVSAAQVAALHEAVARQQGLQAEWPQTGSGPPRQAAAVQEASRYAGYPTHANSEWQVQEGSGLGAPVQPAGAASMTYLHAEDSLAASLHEGHGELESACS